VGALAVACATAGGIARADEVLVERQYRISAREVNCDLDRRRVHAEGDARLSYRDIELRADAVDVDMEANTVAAVGDVRLGQAENRLGARSISYDLDKRTGTVEQASGEIRGQGQAQTLYFAAQSLRVTPKEWVLTNGDFTTCDLPHPEYDISAREIIVRPSDRVIARRTRLFFHGRRLLTLPTWHYSLARGRAGPPLAPVGGYSRLDGLFAGERYSLDLSPSATLDAQAIYTTRRGVRAYADAEVRPPWGAAALTVSRRQDLTQADLGLFAPNAPTSIISVDRLPEVAVALQPTRIGRWADVAARVTGGRYYEQPGDARGSRLSTDLYVQGRPATIRKVSLQPLVGGRETWYDTGQHRHALAWGVVARSQPSDDLALHIGYFQRSGAGSGPFAFDAIDIAREIGVGVGARLGRNWRTEVLARYSLDSGTFPAADVTIIRVQHCLEYGLTWRRVGSLFGVTVGLARKGPVRAPE
jgi:hypothetical protein